MLTYKHDCVLFVTFYVTKPLQLVNNSLRTNLEYWLLIESYKFKVNLQRKKTAILITHRLKFAPVPFRFELLFVLICFCIIFNTSSR